MNLRLLNPPAHVRYLDLCGWCPFQVHTALHFSLTECAQGHSPQAGIVGQYWRCGFRAVLTTVVNSWASFKGSGVTWSRNPKAPIMINQAKGCELASSVSQPNDLLLSRLV